jgi:hypothetical protein
MAANLDSRLFSGVFVCRTSGGKRAERQFADTVF